jgi:hypothetical protein
VTVGVDDDGGMHVRWNDGRAVRVRFTDGDGDAGGVRVDPASG